VSARVLPFHPQADPRERARAQVLDFQKAVRRRLLWRRIKRVMRKGPWAWSR